MNKQVNFKDVVVSELGVKLLVECGEEEYNLIAYGNRETYEWKKIELLDRDNYRIFGYSISEDSQEYSLRAIALRQGNIPISCIFSNFILIKLAEVTGVTDVNSNVDKLKLFICSIMGGCWHPNTSIVNMEIHSEVELGKCIEVAYDKFVGKDMQLIERLGDGTFCVTYLDREITQVLDSLYKNNNYTRNESFKQLFELAKSINKRNEHNIKFNY